MGSESMENNQKMSGGSRCCLGFLAFFAQILLHGLIALTLYWVLQYRWDGEGVPFAWRKNDKTDPEKLWNLHPVLMVTGFIYCMGQAMLVYRSCRCCHHICSKLLHTMFHMLGIPCIGLGFLAIWNYHNIRKDRTGNPAPLPHFYSIHSWLGLVTMGLAAIQFLAGVFTFLLLLCCKSSSRFRSAMVPIHSTVGTTTFILAITTAIAGITETAFYKLREKELGETYTILSEEAIFLNTIGVILIVLAVIMPLIINYKGFRRGLAREGLETG